MQLMPKLGNLSSDLLQNTLSEVGEVQKKLWERSLPLYSREVLGFKPPETLETPPFIIDWYRILQDETIKKLLRLAPRSHAKSQTHSINYPLWEIYRNPDIRIVIASNVADQASGFVRESRTFIETTPQLVDLVPDVRQTKWTDSAFIVKRKLKDKRNPTLSATGASSSILTKRADIIICDDILDEENTRTAGQREKVRTWFWKTLHPVLEPEGRLIMIGTRWHFADFYGELLGEKFSFGEMFKKGIWTCQVQQSILDEESQQVLWPERWPYKKLIELRNQNIPIFNCQYQNDPSGLVGQKFKYDWFRWYDKAGDKITFTTEDGVKQTLDVKDLKIYIGVDPSIKQTEEADYFALIIIGIDNKSRVFVLDLMNVRLTFHNQLKAIFQKIEEWKPVKVGIETVAYQSALQQEVDRISKEKRLYIPVKAIKTTKDKVTRSAKLTNMFEKGIIYMSRLHGQLLSQLLQFPKGEHDDLFDALDFAVDASAEEGLAPRITLA